MYTRINTHNDTRGNYRSWVTEKPRKSQIPLADQRPDQSAEPGNLKFRRAGQPKSDGR